jgi:hypothetical protein
LYVSDGAKAQSDFPDANIVCHAAHLLAQFTCWHYLASCGQNHRDNLISNQLNPRPVNGLKPHPEIKTGKR